MNLYLADSFLRDLSVRSEGDRHRILDVLLALPQAFRHPASHTGIGLRKLHPSGVWEARVGLHLRVVFALQRDLITVRHLMDHDEVRRYLPGL